MFRCSFLDTSALFDFVVRLAGISNGTRPHSHMLPSDARMMPLSPPREGSVQLSLCVHSEKYFTHIMSDSWCGEHAGNQDEQKMHPELDKILYRGLKKKILHPWGLVLKIQAFLSGCLFGIWCKLVQEKKRGLWMTFRIFPHSCHAKRNSCRKKKSLEENPKLCPPSTGTRQTFCLITLKIL